MSCWPKRQVHARGLRHEHRRQRQIQRRAIQVEAVAGRQHERDDVLGHAELSPCFRAPAAARLRSMPWRTRSGTARARRDRSAAPECARSAITAPSTTTTKTTSETYIVSDQLAQAEQHAESLAADRHRHAPRPRPGAPDTSHSWCSGTSLPPAIRRTHHRLRLRADGRAGRAEQEREDHDLQHVAARHGVDNAGREHVLEDRRKAWRCSAARRLRGRRCSLHAIARPHQIHRAQSQKQRDRGDHSK